MISASLIDRVIHANRRVIAVAAYTLVIVCSYPAAFLLRFEFNAALTMIMTACATLPLVLGVRLTLYSLGGLSTGSWRFIGMADVVRLALLSLAGSILVYVFSRLTPYPVPLTVVLIECVLTTNIIAGVWIVYRAVFEYVRHWQSPTFNTRRAVLIIGAGEAGTMLAREMLRLPTGYRPLAFVDDDPRKLRSKVYGLYVVGNLEQLPRLAAGLEVDELIIAAPSATPSQLRRIVELCEETGLPFKVLPGIADVLAGNVSLNQLREVRIEDLLGREPIELALPELSHDLAGKTVLVTGAAGSIGSELVRQIALHEPARLVLFDQAETDLFYVNNELRERHPDLEIHCIIGDIVDKRTVDLCFGRFRPDRVYHAAAYKHVPMMELNSFEAAHNNVLGTWRVANAAGRTGCGTFILVSTDKAVRPRNYMGATKRLAEVMTLRLQAVFPKTTFGVVRFGNVLGSNGSVIPVFRRQLAAGQPLTVTHPDVTRFFMTIPEAVQLILQASLLKDIRGKIAMLDMGEPMRIVDLARNLLHLAGIPEEGRIVFSGLRPGEKLHEELSAPDEASIATSVARVSLLESRVDTLPDHRPMLVALEEGHDTLALRIMRKWFTGLQPSEPEQVRAPMLVRTK